MTHTLRKSPDIDRLRAFAVAILDLASDALDIDASDVQDLAAEHGLIEEVEVTEPCGEACICAEGSDFPTTCYRRTALVEVLP